MILLIPFFFVVLFLIDKLHSFRIVLRHSFKIKQVAFQSSITRRFVTLVIDIYSIEGLANDIICQKRLTKEVKNYALIRNARTKLRLTAGCI